MRCRLLALFVLITVCYLPGVTAQTTSGSIAGTILDQHQGTVAGAVVTATEEAKRFSLSAITDAEGRFVFPQVPPGTYTISVEATGFKKLQRRGMELVSNDRLSLGHLVVDVGATSETVTVTGDATLIQAESGERSFAIQHQVIENIGINTRSFVNLAALAPGVIFTTSDGQGGDITNFSANGVRTNSNNLQIDGITNVDTGNNGGPLSNLTLDSVQEFKILTSNYQAEYGRSVGAQIIAVTRGGSREFRGSFYLYRRQGGLNANTWINNRDGFPRPRQDQRDLGYTIGGPVYIPRVFNQSRQKLFFFFSQEYQHRFNPPTGPTRVRVPTALERAGDFSQSRDNNNNLYPYIRDYTQSGLCQATPATTSPNYNPTVNYQAACYLDQGILGRIPQNRLYQPGLNILRMYPEPNYVPRGGDNFNYVSQEPSNTPERDDTLRIDYNLTSNWRVNGRYLRNKADFFLPYGDFVLGGNLPPLGARRVVPRYSFSATVSGSFNTTTILELTYGVSHNRIDILPGSEALTRTASGLTGLPALYPAAVTLDLVPQFTFGGRVANGPNAGTQNAPFYNFNTTQDVAGSISKIWRSHTFKTGIYWHRSEKPQSSFAPNNGVINFTDSANNQFDTSFAFANAATGVFQSYQQASARIIGNYKYFNLEWYFQDNFKVNKRFVLDYGIRFNWLPPQYDTDLQGSNFLPDQFDSARVPRLYLPVCINGAAVCDGANVNANMPDPLNTQANRRAVDPALLVPGFVPTAANTLPGINVGRVVPGSGSLANGIFVQGRGIEQGLMRDRGIQFGPRFGFGYDVTGKQQFVIRGGIGFFYDRPQGNIIFDQVRNPPTTFESVVNFGRLQDLSSGITLISPPRIEARDHEGKIPTVYSFNLGVQYKLPLGTVLDASYVGSMGHHLLRARNLNATPYGATFLPQNQDPTRSPNAVPGAVALPAVFLSPNIGYDSTVRLLEFAENSNYHSMQISVNRRFSNGLLIGTNYTWSKALGRASDDFAFVRIDSFDRMANYGPQNFDRRHNLTANWVYDLPRATRNQKLGRALNDWKLSGIYHYQSGQPYTLGFGVQGYGNANLTGSYTEPARIVMLRSPGSGHSRDPYRQFDTTAVAAPNVGSIGLESGRNYLTRNPINYFDLSLSKSIKLRERIKIEARLDAFNAFNHTQFNGVNTGAFFTAPGSTAATNAASETNRNGFGAINSVRPPRQMQWMLRFQF
ncbi:MAG TPA: TonB-dependent receptor [Blastocatellia bacterium]|nr:TonB-dependent receptor [Blastocatellia bacterium]